MYDLVRSAHLRQRLLRFPCANSRWLCRSDALCVITQASYYDVLSVAKDASDADIRKAYRAAALTYHPGLCNTQ